MILNSHHEIYIKHLQKTDHFLVCKALRQLNNCFTVAQGAICVRVTPGLPEHTHTHTHTHTLTHTHTHEQTRTNTHTHTHTETQTHAQTNTHTLCVLYPYLL